MGAIAVALALLAVAGYRATRTTEAATAAPIKISVLPFGNTANDTAAVGITDGLPEEIATALGRVPGIQIQSRSGARAYSGQLSVNVTEVGPKLGADYVMTAVARREGGNWILSADLSRAADGASIWGENFTISPKEQARAVETIVSTLLGALRSRFPNTIGADPVLALARNPMANDLFLRGQYLLSRRQQSVTEAADFFRLAIREDSLFAPAWSGLSMALVLTPFFHGTDVRIVTDSVVSAANRALQLNPRLAQPHVALGINHWYAYRWDSAEVEFNSAIARDVHDVEARIQYGRHLRYLGRGAEAMDQMRIARADDPASAVLLSHIAYNHYLNGQLDSATIVIRLALDIDPSNYTTLANGALIYIRANRLEEARALVARMNLPQGIVGYLRARTGDLEGARRQVQHFDAQIGLNAGAHTARALAYLGLDDTTKALDGLEAATKAHEIWHVMRSVNDPIFDPIRESGRFTALLQSVGLPASAATRRSQK